MDKRRQVVGKLKFTSRLALVILLVVILFGLGADLFAFHSPQLPSGPALEGPSRVHWLGTDDLGIDLWAQICQGARISILVGFGVAVLAGIGGGLIGMLAGYYGGCIDRLVMRTIDLMLVLPDLLLMIVLGAFFGPSISNIIIVLSLLSWAAPARIVRSRLISLKQEQRVTAAYSYGAGFWHLTRYHFLPELLPLLMVSNIKLVGKTIVAEASLSFLGLGDPTAKSWGIILNHAINFPGIYFTPYWRWWVLSPLVALTVLIAAIAVLSRDIEKIINTKI